MNIKCKYVLFHLSVFAFEINPLGQNDYSTKANSSWEIVP